MYDFIFFLFLCFTRICVQFNKKGIPQQSQRQSNMNDNNNNNLSQSRISSLQNEISKLQQQLKHSRNVK